MTSSLTIQTARYEPGELSVGKKALIFAPVIPTWDEGRFFLPIINELTSLGYSVTVVDSLSLLHPHANNFMDFVQRWRNELERFEEFDLYAGNALGGALLQGLLPSLNPTAQVLLVSAPTIADEQLESRLEDIANLAATGQTSAALELLNHRVQASNTRTKNAGIEAIFDERINSRLSAGLRLLHGLDVSDQIRTHRGTILSFTGACSQLVGRQHLTDSRHHHIHEVPDSGMRPHSDQPERVRALIREFLKGNA